MTISEYITSFKECAKVRKASKNPVYSGATHIVCRDGFSISVQAGEYMYCSPRNDHGPWSQVECGFPSAVPELIMEYAEEADNPTQTVYGFVPVELVEQLITLHGGSSQLEQ